MHTSVGGDMGSEQGRQPDYGAMRPTLAQALRDAIAYHYDGRCGDLEHLAWVEQYERALDVLDPTPVLATA